MKIAGQQAEPPVVRKAHGLDFPVVGIGASAGGMAALQRFFDNMPADCGMAFVVVLHLSAKHESNAAIILQHCTSMHVIQVREKVRMEAGKIYVIPPNHVLIMEDGNLDLMDRADTAGPIAIDLFFRTMADAHGERAMGIVLSGMGSDGAVGLTRIKENGGVTLVQLPEDAEYDSMPRAAIGTGHVDIVLPVVDMPQRLIEIWRNAREIRMPSESDAGARTMGSLSAEQAAEEALQSILKIVRIRTNHDFRHYKKATILRRLERRLQVRGLPDLIAYCEFLNSNVEETDLLLQDMLISVTNYFRDRECFDALERDVIPSLFEKRQDNDSIRVWVAGCATGEEAYSISILLREHIDRVHENPEVQIFATDIDDHAINIARAGTYPGAIIADVSPQRLQNYFAKEDGQYRVVKSVREPVLFAAHNVLRDPPFSRLDLICCRNLLIYLDREAQKNVIEMFHFALKPNGYLFLGNSETEDAAPNLFTIVDKKNRIYRANDRAQTARYLPAFPSQSFVSRSRTDHTVIRERRHLSFAQVHQQALEQHAVPSVLIDSEYNILHLSPSVTRFLAHQAGEPSHSILSNVHPDLRLELRTALFKASQSGGSVDTTPIRMQYGGGPATVKIAVRHFHTEGDQVATMLVIFEELATIDSVASDQIANPAAELIVNHLESEIKRYKEDLQATIERSEISTEELKASNEELQTINEELRSATEELETSKEELQSMNEELITLNYELKRKIEETDASNDYLHNLIASTEIATVFIDRQMNIVRFTPRATDIFNLIPSDHGRPLMDIRHRLDYDALTDDASEAFRNLRTLERKIQSLDGKYYLARVLPYRTKDDKIEGAVLTFIDITALHQAEERVRAGEERLRIAAESTKDYAIITLDEQGLVTTWNAGAERSFGYTEQEMQGKPLDCIYTPEDRENNVPALELQHARSDSRTEDERWHLRKNGAIFYASGVVTSINNDVLQGFVKIARDMTGSKRLEVERDAQLLHEKDERQKMEYTNQMRNEFLAVMSHELKNPLNLIHVNAELLAHLPETRQSAQAARATEVIRRTVLTQAKIIDDLLDLSRARTGKLTLNLGTALLNDITAAIVTAARVNAAEKSIAVDFDCTPDPLLVSCDQIRIEQILWNLLSNAVKFTPGGGSVRVTLDRIDSWAQLVVTDTGDGIATADLQAVFEMFHQSGGKSRPAPSGMGIGLALVKELVQAHGGTVEASSPGLGKGAAFTVQLPLDRNLTASAHQSDYGDSLRGLHLLLVDDSEESLEPLAQLLRVLGAEVTAVTSGAAALAALDNTQFDVLISDIGMDDMDGYELITTIRQRADAPYLPAIALTGYGMAQDLEKAEHSGFDAHLGKPASLDDLQQVIQRLRNTLSF